MTSIEEEISEAIKRSISHNEIVHISCDSSHPDISKYEAALAVNAESYVQLDPDTHGGCIMEAWGEDWRVHLDEKRF